MFLSGTKGVESIHTINDVDLKNINLVGGAYPSSRNIVLKINDLTSYEYEIKKPKRPTKKQNNR